MFGRCIVFLGTLSQLTVCNAFTTCEKRSACSCMSDEGLIDLTPLDGSGVPRFQNVPGDPEFTYSYNPCTPVNINDACPDVAICEVGPSFSTAIASHTTAEFSVQGGSVQIKMQDDKIYYYTSFIQLVCDQSQAGTFERVSGNPPIFNFKLTSKYACPAGGGGGGGGGGLSPGSIMCILLLVFVCVYLVGGGIYKWQFREATGVEVIPNVSFWRELPSLIKDGVKFVFSGCKNPGYAEM